MRCCCSHTNCPIQEEKPVFPLCYCHRYLITVNYSCQKNKLDLLIKSWSLLNGQGCRRNLTLTKNVARRNVYESSQKVLHSRWFSVMEEFSPTWPHLFFHFGPSSLPLHRSQLMWLCFTSSLDHRVVSLPSCNPSFVADGLVGSLRGQSEWTNTVWWEGEINESRSESSPSHFPVNSRRAERSGRKGGKRRKTIKWSCGCFLTAADKMTRHPERHRRISSEIPQIWLTNIVFWQAVLKAF